MQQHNVTVADSFALAAIVKFAITFLNFFVVKAVLGLATFTKKSLILQYFGIRQYFRIP